MATSTRTKKVSAEIKFVLDQLIRREINDPRVLKVGFVTISDIRLSPDHKAATVFVSFMDKNQNSKEAKNALVGLNNSASFLHRRLVKELAMKNVPTLKFMYDNSFDRAVQVSRALNAAKKMNQRLTSLVNPTAN